MSDLRIPAPADFISANQRLNHWRKAELTKAWRSAAHMAAQREGLRPVTSRVHIVAAVHKAHGRQYDAGNYYPTAKACVDGLRDAGVLVDDSNAYVVGPDMRHGGKSAEPCLHLTITEIPIEGDSDVRPA